MAQLFSASLQAMMTTISSSCHTSLIHWVSTTDTYILFDKPIYSPLLWSKGWQNVIQCFIGHKYKKLTADEGCHLTHAQNTKFWSIWKAVLNVSNNCKCNFIFVCMYLFKCMGVFCAWASFTEWGEIISYAVSF